MRNRAYGELLEKAKANSESSRRGAQQKLRMEEFRELSGGMIGPTRNSSRGGDTKTKMRIGTMIIDLTDSHGVDVMAIQETRLKKELEPAAKGWAKRRGCSMTAEKCYSGRTGNDEGGVCILSKLPVQQVRMSDNRYIRGTSCCRASKKRRGHTTLRVWSCKQHRTGDGDEPWQCGLKPSRRTGGHVDHMIHCNNTRIDHREAVEGIADKGNKWPEV